MLDFVLIFTNVAVMLAVLGIVVFSANRFCLFLSLSDKNLPLRENFLATAVFSVFIMLFSSYLCGRIFTFSSLNILYISIVILICSLMVSMGIPYKFPAMRMRFIMLMLVLPVLLYTAFTMAVYLPRTPVEWDAMTYHLYIPACWIQEGNMFPIHTVFGDNAAGFAPKNWCLFLAWFMCFIHADYFLNMLPEIFIMISVVSIYGIAVLLGAGRMIAFVISATLACMPVIVLNAYLLGSDMGLLSFLLAGLYFTIKYSMTFSKRDFITASLSLGLAAGMKTVGPLFVLPLILFLLWKAVRNGKYVFIFLFPLLFIAAGGWNYIESIILYGGNPFFPLDISIGGIRIFEGAYNTAAVRAGEFYEGVIYELNKRLYFSYGVIVYLMMLTGWIAYLKIVFKKPAAFFVFMISCLWILFYIYIIPNNKETRFLFPALALSLPGLAVFLSMYAKRRWVLTAGILLSICLLGGYFMKPLNLIIMNGSFTVYYIISIFICTGFVFTFAMAFVSKKYRKILFSSSVVFLSAMIVFAGIVSPEMRAASFYQGGYGALFGKAYSIFNDVPALKLPALKIAYTGNNLTYGLIGADLRNKVYYCNVQGSFKDGFYEFWKSRGSKTYAYHKPLIYRDCPDYEKWLRNLSDSHSELLFVAVLHHAERKYIPCDERGFPIEAVWADAHPEKFSLLFYGVFYRVYQINP